MQHTAIFENLEGSQVRVFSPNTSLSWRQAEQLTMITDAIVEFSDHPIKEIVSDMVALNVPSMVFKAEGMTAHGRGLSAHEKMVRAGFIGRTQTFVIRLDNDAVTVRFGPGFNDNAWGSDLVVVIDRTIDTEQQILIPSISRINDVLSTVTWFYMAGLITPITSKLEGLVLSQQRDSIITKVFEHINLCPFAYLKVKELAAEINSIVGNAMEDYGISIYDLSARWPAERNEFGVWKIDLSDSPARVNEIVIDEDTLLCNFHYARTELRSQLAIESIIKAWEATVWTQVN